MLKNFVTLTFIGLFSISCVQIPIGNSEPESYKNVDFESPKNFSSIKASSSDQAWIKNGNIISYRTECPTQVRRLESLKGTLTSGFVNSKIIEEKKIRYNNREAVRFSFNADIESIPSKFDLVAFKKYSCLFLITHNGRLESLNKTAGDFESFLSSFKVTQ